MELFSWVVMGMGRGLEAAHAQEPLSLPRDATRDGLVPFRTFPPPLRVSLVCFPFAFPFPFTFPFVGERLANGSLTVRERLGEGRL